MAVVFFYERREKVEVKLEFVGPVADVSDLLNESLQARKGTQLFPGMLYVNLEFQEWKDGALDEFPMARKYRGKGGRRTWTVLYKVFIKPPFDAGEAEALFLRVENNTKKS